MVKWQINRKMKKINENGNEINEIMKMKKENWKRRRRRK